MTLALISDNSTKHGEQAVVCALASLGDSPITVGYFSSSPDPTRIYFKQTEVFYKNLGAISVLYVELEDEFDEGQIEQALQCNVIHLSGGDTYRFLYWLKIRDIEKKLIEFHQRGNVIIGISAGAIMLTPSIDSAQLCGDENTVGLIDTAGLALTPFLFSPHASKSTIEQVNAKQIARNCIEIEEIVLCCDDDALIISNSLDITEFGSPTWHSI